MFSGVLFNQPALAKSRAPVNDNSPVRGQVHAKLAQHRLAAGERRLSYRAGERAASSSRGLPLAQANFGTSRRPCCRD